MKVIVTRETKTREEIDIEFPFYEHAEHGDNYTAEYWYRYDSDGRYWLITRTAGDRGIAYEIQHQWWGAQHPLNGVLELRDHGVDRKSDAVEFHKALGDALRFIEGIYT